MPALDSANIIDLKQDKLQNRGRRLSIGVIMDLEKLPADERRKVMRRSLDDQQRAKALDALERQKVEPFTKLVESLMPMIKQAGSFAELGKLASIKEAIPKIKFPKLEKPTFNPPYYPLPVSDEERTTAEVRKLRQDVARLEKLLNQPLTPRRARHVRIHLTPNSFDAAENILSLGPYQITFKRAGISSTVLNLIFENNGRLRRKWDFDGFFETHQRQLYKGSVENSGQIRSALGRINNTVALKTNGTILGLFVIDNGFRVNPKYLQR